jgi:hypothetical protein
LEEPEFEEIEPGHVSGRMTLEFTQ